MERPRITIHILSALDGKISGPFMALPAAQAAAREYAGLRAAYEADAWLYGATTTKEFTGHRRPVLGCGEHAAPPGDFVAESHAGPLLCLCRYVGRDWVGIRHLPAARTTASSCHRNFDRASPRCLPGLFAGAGRLLSPCRPGFSGLPDRLPKAIPPVWHSIPAYLRGRHRQLELFAAGRRRRGEPGAGPGRRRRRQLRCRVSAIPVSAGELPGGIPPPDVGAA